MAYERYAIYYVPPPGALAEFGASWLGWDIALGVSVSKTAVADLPLPLEEITTTPRKYGFHATLKPPFRLAEKYSETELVNAVDILGDRTLCPVEGLSLELTQLGRFLALTAKGNIAQLGGLAAMCVETLDPFRAPASDAELTKRRAPGLSQAQEEMLLTWGYPHVMDLFRFHMTLTGKLPKQHLAQMNNVLNEMLQEFLARPFILNSICLVGEDTEGRFHIVKRYELSA